MIATGETHSVKEFLELAFKQVGLEWQGHVTVDPKLLRPSEVFLLLGDATKAREQLAWSPRTTFRELVDLMVDADWEVAKQERQVKELQSVA